MTSVRFTGLHMVNLSLIPEAQREQFLREVRNATRPDPARGKEATLEQKDDMLLINTRPGPRGLGKLFAWLESEDSRSLKRRGESSLDRGLASLFRNWYIRVLEAGFGGRMPNSPVPAPIFTLRLHGDGRREADGGIAIPAEAVNRFTQGLLPDEVRIHPSRSGRAGSVTFKIHPRFSLSASETDALEASQIKPLFERLNNMSVVRVVKRMDEPANAAPTSRAGVPRRTPPSMTPIPLLPLVQPTVNWLDEEDADPLTAAPPRIGAPVEVAPEPEKPDFPVKRGKRNHRNEGMLPVKRVYVRRHEAFRPNRNRQKH